MAAKRKVDLVEGQLPFKAGEQPAQPWDQIEELKGTGFDEAVERYLEYKQEIEALEERKKVESVWLQATLMSVNQKAVRYGEHQVILCDGRSASKLSKEKLIEKGVSPDLIVKCTIPGKEYTYVQVVKDKSGAL